MMVRQALESRRAWLALVCVVLVGTAGAASAQTRSGRVVRLLDSFGAMEGSTIGIEVDDVAANDATEEGAFVNAVREGSPAESAGFAEGDVVVGFDGERVRGVRQLTRLVRETPVGRTVTATVLRDGSRVELLVTPEAGGPSMPHLPELLSRGRDEYDARNFTFDIPQLPGRPRLGVTVQRLSPQLADYFGVAEGLLVSNVAEGSVAAEAGVMAGDVITALDGRAVDSSRSLRRRLSAVDAGEEVSISVTRGGRELSLTATLTDTRPRAHRYQFLGEDDSTLE